MSEYSSREQLILPLNYGRSTQSTSTALNAPRLPDWYCPTCNFKIFGSKEMCRKCGVRNPALRTNVTPQNSSATSTTYSIAPHRATQEATTKTIESLMKVSDQIHELSEKITDAEYKNILDDLKTCYDQVSKPTPTHTSSSHTSFTHRADWWCSTCNYKIYASKSSCKKCGAQRPN